MMCVCLLFLGTNSQSQNGSNTSPCLVTLLHFGHTTPCQSHISMLITVLPVSHSPPCKSHSSMLVTLLHVSHTPPRQSHYSMLVTLIHVSQTKICQSHFSMLVPLIYVREAFKKKNVIFSDIVQISFHPYPPQANSDKVPK